MNRVPCKGTGTVLTVFPVPGRLFGQHVGSTRVPGFFNGSGSPRFLLFSILAQELL